MELAAGILGTGSELPEKVITNFDLEKMVETSDQWITERTGIKERRQAAPHETTSTLSVKASRKALEMAGITPEDLDLIICSTISPDMPLPSTAAFIQRDLGARSCCAFDLAAACSPSCLALRWPNNSSAMASPNMPWSSAQSCFRDT